MFQPVFSSVRCLCYPLSSRITVRRCCICEIKYPHFKISLNQASQWFGSLTVIPRTSYIAFVSVEKLQRWRWPFADKLVSLAFSQNILQSHHAWRSWRQLWIDNPWYPRKCEGLNATKKHSRGDLWKDWGDWERAYQWWELSLVSDRAFIRNRLGHRRWLFPCFKSYPSVGISRQGLHVCIVSSWLQGFLTCTKAPGQKQEVAACHVYKFKWDHVSSSNEGFVPCLCAHSSSQGCHICEAICQPGTMVLNDIFLGQILYFISLPQRESRLAYQSTSPGCI